MACFKKRPHKNINDIEDCMKDMVIRTPSGPERALIMSFSLVEWKSCFYVKCIRGRLVTWLRTRNHIKCCLVKKKKLIFNGKTHQNVSLTACLCCFSQGKKQNSGAWLHCCTVHFSEQFFLFFFNEKHGKNSFFFLEKLVQLIDFTCIVHLNMNNIVF